MCSASVGGGTKPILPRYSTSTNVSPSAIQEAYRTGNKFQAAALAARQAALAKIPKVPPAPDKGPTFGLRIQPDAVGAADLRNPFMPSVKRNG